ncbi:hypothetical protein [Streptomyces niveus]|uniref:hypothetical protein n=1 Tax=Streptomyces niveus TaxID=193462 RepID=UPI0034269525
MDELISSEDLMDQIIGSGLLGDLYAWYDANGLGRVYLNDPVVVGSEGGRRVIRYTVDVSELDGPHLAEKRTVPLVVEPPAVLRREG